MAVTAGASAPEVLVDEVVAYLRGRGFADVEEVEVMPENVRFGLPPEIVQAIRPAGVQRTRYSVRLRFSRESVKDQMSRSFESTQPAVPRFGRLDAGLDKVEAAIERAQDFLFSQQHPDGYWCGELEADCTLESDYIMLHTLLGTGNERKMKRAAEEIHRKQNEDGGWSIYAGGPRISALRSKHISPLS